jgi:DNA-binding transcriptional LysR family regulator
MDEIDRILSSEALVEPSPQFTQRVMAGVRLPPPMPFPWRRVAAAAAMIFCASAGLAAMPGVLPSLEALDWQLVGGTLSVLALSFGLASATLWLAWRAD